MKLSFVLHPKNFKLNSRLQILEPIKIQYLFSFLSIYYPWHIFQYNTNKYTFTDRRAKGCMMKSISLFFVRISIVILTNQQVINGSWSQLKSCCSGRRGRVKMPNFLCNASVIQMYYVFTKNESPKQTSVSLK